MNSVFHNKRAIAGLLVIFPLLMYGVESNRIDSLKTAAEDLRQDTGKGKWEKIRSIHLRLSEIYEEEGKFREAYDQYALYSDYHDSVANEEKAKEVGMLEAKFEMEKQQEEEKYARELKERQEAEARSRRDNLQYSAILIVIVSLVIGLFFGGRWKVPLRFAQGMIFFTFLLFFEFVLVLLDPYIDEFSGGEPAYKLCFNAVLAGLIFPIHSFFTNKLKKRFER